VMVIMPFQNRVEPFGNFLVTEARGALMGNRGFHHDDEQRIVRRHAVGLFPLVHTFRFTLYLERSAGKPARRFRLSA